MKSHEIIKLDVPNPCTKNWDGMSPGDKGRFCKSCSKHVKDFTNLSDEELNALFNTAQGPVCGRLYPEQLNHYLITNSRRSRPLLSQLLLGAALTIGLANKNSAQTLLEKSMQVQTETMSEKKKEAIPASTSDSLRHIKGKVRDAASGEALPFVTVIVKGTSNGTFTDTDGKFELSIPNDVDKNNTTLQISYIGYENKEMKIAMQKAPVTIELKMSMGPVLMGVIAVNRKRNFWLKITRPLRKKYRT